MEKVIWVITTIVLFVTVACVCYYRGKKVGAIDKYEYGEKCSQKTADLYNAFNDRALEQLNETRKENLRLSTDKEKAVKACRKYRERANLLEHNLNNLIDTYQSNENNLFEAVKQNAFLAGQVQAYQKALPDSTSKEK